MNFLLKTVALALLFFVAAPGLQADDSPVPVSEEAAASAWEEAAADLRLQTQMPENKPPPPAPAKRRGFSLADFLSSLSDGAEVARFLLWGALAALLVLIILKVADSLRRREPLDPDDGEGAEHGAPEAVAARLDQAHLEAEELARRGQFAQAMHLLLLRSLGEMRLRLGVPIAVSLTSREIVVRAPLGDRTRAALADVVGRVEITYFGERAAGEPEYRACRSSFEFFTQNLRAGGRA